MLQLVVTFISETKHLSISITYVKLKSKLIGNLKEMLEIIKNISGNSSNSNPTKSESKKYQPKNDTSLLSQLANIVDNQDELITPAMPEFQKNYTNPNSKTPIIEEIVVRKTTPKYYITERSGTSLELKVYLPLIESVSEIDLEISQKDAELTSNQYTLSVMFDRKIDDNNIKAKFDKTTKNLIIYAPILN